MKFASRTGLVASAAALTLVVAACSPSNEATPTATSTTTSTTDVMTLKGELNGAGSSAQQSAEDAWRAGFQTANPDVTVNYDPIGSGGGRTNFLNGDTSFAGSDAIMSADEYASAVTRCDGDGGAIHLPVYVSPLAVVFNLEGIDSLNMSADVIAQIFDGKITKWNDAAIAGANPGVDLPNLAITPVHRADESGTTSNFTDYLEKASTSWPYAHGGEWPNEIGEAGPQTSGLIQIVQDNNGTIGYADASQAGTLGTVAIGVGDSFVAISADAAANAVATSPLQQGANGPEDFAYDLNRASTDPTTYPLVLVSYQILCKQYDDANERELVTSYIRYVVSEEGQNAAASAAGSAPMNRDLAGKVDAVLDQIAAG